MISSWMQGLVIYIILSGLVMKLVPGKSYERYISLYMGFILVIIISKPVLMFFNFDETNAESLMESLDGYLSFYREDYENIENNSNYYGLGVGEAIKESCRENGIVVYDVSVITDNKNNVLNVIIYTDQNTNENYLKTLINDVYKFDFESIYIVRR
ncbi:MAG: stage III sporulation protein AF [Lachnospiraceae bacterium]|nr:stage III sporulation protein AF [Lachnospiraceae bacterium]